MAHIEDIAERVGGVPPQLYECAECSQPDCNWRGECDGESCPACGGHVVPAGVKAAPHVGESCFEGWYSERDFAGRYNGPDGPHHNKQDMRDAYAAGLAEAAAGVTEDQRG